MGRFLGSYIMPHPPIIIPEVGKGSETGASATIEAMKEASAEIAALKPSTILLTSPHGAVFSDYVYIADMPVLSGDLGRFGAADVRLEFENNSGLVSLIVRYASGEGIQCGGLEDSLKKKYKVSRDLDHGALVPLYYISREYAGFKLVHISMAMLPFEELYTFGKCVAKAIHASDENAVFVASGDLSHRLSTDAPYGFNKKGPEFDRMLVESLREFDPLKLMQLDEDICDEAGECGLRSFLMMFGALDGYEVKSRVYSYEGPFGVGYSVAGFKPEGRKEDSHILEKLAAGNRDRLKQVRDSEDPYVKLARITLETYVKTGRIMHVPETVTEEMLKNRAGVFVSIKKSGQLRGCIGTIQPVRDSIAEEIVHNAVSAGTQDPRFEGVEEDELDKLVYSVDILADPEPIESTGQLDVKRYGVIVRLGRRSGLLLPNLEGIDSPEEQVSIALKKAGIGKDEAYKMERFEVVRHK